MLFLLETGLSYEMPPPNDGDTAQRVDKTSSPNDAQRFQVDATPT